MLQSFCRVRVGLLKSGSTVGLASSTRVPSRYVHVLSVPTVNASHVQRVLPTSSHQKQPVRLMAKKAKGKSGKGGKGGAASNNDKDDPDADMPKELDLEKIEKNMKGSIAHTMSQLENVRTGQASAVMFDFLSVESHGSKVPLSAIGQVAVRDPKTVVINCYDPSAAQDVINAIVNADMGLNPSPAQDGIIRVPIPKTTKETRLAMVKKAKELGEKAKIGLRLARGKGMDQLKALNLPKDDARLTEKKIQALNDQVSKQIDTVVGRKIATLEK
eukprot:CFRG0770T1